MRKLKADVGGRWTCGNLSHLRDEGKPWYGRGRGRLDGAGVASSTTLQIVRCHDWESDERVDHATIRCWKKWEVFRSFPVKT